MPGQGGRLGKEPQNRQFGFMCILLLVRRLTQDLKSPPKESSVKLIDVHLKLLLSCCNHFVKSYQEKKQIPFWSTKENYLSLLNLAEQVAEFRSLRWYWDGTRERYIQTVKKDLVEMRRSTSYFHTKMIKIQKIVVMR